MQKNQINDHRIQERLAPFAYLNKEFRLVLFDHPPISYDEYYREAIEIMDRIRSKRLNYDMVVQLRMWIRENYQHGHYLSFDECQNLMDVKRKIDEIIRLDCIYVPADMYDQLKFNEEVFKS